MSGRVIDLNCDMGEASTPEQDAVEAALMRAVTSASVACTGHAGDERTMTTTVCRALDAGVNVGAHPSYPDRAGFGRAEMAIGLDELERSIDGQLRVLRRVCEREGARLAHVKAHGALYHSAMRHEPIARLLGRRVLELCPGAVIFGPSGGAMLHVWRGMGLAVVEEAFADRRYEPDGTLMARSKPGAVLADPEAAAAQCVSIVEQGAVVAADGSRVAMPAQTLCVHSDSPGALATACRVRAALGGRGIVVRAGW